MFYLGGSSQIRVVLHLGKYACVGAVPVFCWFSCKINCIKIM